MKKTKNMGALKLKKEILVEFESISGIVLKERYTSYLKDYLNGVKPDLSIQTIDLNDCIQKSIQRASKYTGTSEITVSYSIKGQNKFYSNPYYLEFIFDQLIENGILYHDDMKSEPILNIELLVENDRLTFEIVDNGIGIPDDQIPHIFNMHYWFSEKSKGYGIGLTLVKQFVENLSGNIYFNSALGIGSHVQIQIPNSFAF